MRKPEADYDSVEEALPEHHLQTIRECARARGYTAETMWEDPVCCAMAVALVVDLGVAQAAEAGRSRREALLHAAERFDMDVATLLRQDRRRRERGGPD